MISGSQPLIAVDPRCESNALASKVNWKKPVKAPAVAPLTVSKSDGQQLRLSVKAIEKSVALSPFR